MKLDGVHACVCVCVAIVFCYGVQHRLQFCLDHLSCVKMAAFQFYLQPRKKRKVGWVGDDRHVVFDKKVPGEKGSVRRCVVVVQEAVLMSPKLGVKSSHLFYAVTVKRRSNMRNRLFGLPGRILYEQSC
jgi:hypothetical protein